MTLTTKLRHLRLMLWGAVVCVVSLMASPASFAQGPFSGVYTGTFSGPGDNGEFAVLVQTNGAAIVMAFDSLDELGFLNENVTVNSDGSFAKSNIDGAGTFVSGTFTSTEVTGTIVNSNGFTSTFQGTKQPANGFARDIGGLYQAPIAWNVRFNGAPVGTVSGTWSVLVAANGVYFELLESLVSIQFQGQQQVDRVDAGGLGSGSSVEELCESVDAGTFTATCTFDPNTLTFSGSVFASESGVTISGPYSLTRREPLPDLPPLAADDNYSVLANRSLTITAADGVLANDSDPEEDPLTAELITAPTHGSLSLNADGAFTYTPDPRFSGVDSFTYRVQARSSQSNTATVTITVDRNSAAPWLVLLLND